jgi:ABC-2 type transport system ATP-binding protein
VTGLLRPEAGRAEVDGVDVWADPVAVKTRLGLVPDNPRLFDRLSARELLSFTGLLRGMDPAVIERRATELLAILDLEADADTLVADFSLGMTKRIGIATALLHAPRVLFLDEPFGALDPVNAAVVESILHRFRAGGGTVVFSSHVMDVVERLCDRVAVIADGRVVAGGTTAEVAAGRRLQDVFVELVGARDLTEDHLGWLGSSSG